MAVQGRKKILQIVEDLKVGGLERMIQGLATGLPADRYEVSVWCLAGGGRIAGEISAAGLKVEVLGMGPRCTFLFLLRLVKKIKAEHYDVIHAHGYTAGVVGRAAGLLAGVPVIIYHVHSTYLEYTFKQLLIEKMLSLATDRILCCSRAVADFVADREKISRAKLAVIYNGVSDMRWPGVAKRAGLGFSPEDFVIGLAASMTENKGHACFLEAMKEVASVCPAARAVLAGDGPLRGRLEERVKDLGLEGSVVFGGIMDDMPSFWSSVDLAVLPSVEREGLGLVILEAMSAGKAVAASRLGGIPEAVEDGVTGLLVPPRDPAALAGAILSLAGNRDRLAGMGLAGRKKYEEKFTLAVMVTGISKVYDEITG